nr:ATP-binding protein [Ramlibacter albus]
MAGLVTSVLVAGSALGFWFFGRQNESQLADLQREKAVAAATRIGMFMKDIEHQLGWTTLPRPAPADAAQRRLEFVKLLRQVPAVAEVAWADATGRERLRMSRLALDVEEEGADRSSAAYFRQARSGRPYFGAVYFRKDSEPYMTMAARTGEGDEGVVAAEVNLKFVWDVVTQVKVGRTGVAYVVDRAGNLLAHHDISLVLQKTSLATLTHVAAATQGHAPAAAGGFVRSLQGQEVLSSSAPVEGLGWTVFVEMPRTEALEPLYALAWRGLAFLIAALAVAVAASVMLARRMVHPIRELQAGAQDVGAGRLDRRIDVRTGDELEALAAQFNTMTRQLTESYGTLEQKVQQRTQALSEKNTQLNAALQSLALERQRAESANLAKSRFLAAASHDLRQPMHALNLYLGALAAQELPAPAQRLLGNLRQCALTMDDLFEGLLDISKLDAKAVEPQLSVFAIAPLLARIGVEFEPQALAKGVLLHVVPSRACVRSDPVIVERIVRNLVSNAVRYTAAGRIVVGCRHRRGQLCVQVHDTGVGIAPELHETVFEEFFQVANQERDRGKGLGLGLSIVKRLAQLLAAPIRLASRPGRGSMFEIALPLALVAQAAPPPAPRGGGPLHGKLVVVVDDEAAVLDASRVLLEKWGCEVVTAASGAEAVARLASCPRAPDVLVCDYRLRPPENGLLVLEALREEFNRQIPALLVTGDVLAGSLDIEASERVVVLHKPVADDVLRDALAQAAASADTAVAAGPGLPQV